MVSFQYIDLHNADIANLGKYTPKASVLFTLKLPLDSRDSSAC